MDEKQAFIKFLQADKCSVEEFALARKYAKEQSSIEVEQIFNKLYAIVKNVLEEVVASNYRSVHDAKYIYIRWGISDDYFDKVNTGSNSGSEAEGEGGDTEENEGSESAHR